MINEDNLEVKNIVLIGVGGQGTILVSKIITTALVSSGYDVKMSEIHGMAQRGGSVLTQIRYGKKVYSPIIGEGEADILVASEKMEALRGSSFLKADGIIVVNDYAIIPLPVATGKVKYPENIVKALADKFKTISIDAGAKALELGNIKVMNVVLLGALVEAFALNELDWERAILANVRPQYQDINLKAFTSGRLLSQGK